MPAWKLFLRYLFSRRAESLIRSIAKLAIVATFIGVAALVLVMSVMNGFNRNIQNKLLAIEPHIAITSPAEDINVESVIGDELKNTSLYSEQDLILRTVDGLFSGGVGRGLKPDRLEEMLARIFQVQGYESLSLELDSLGPNEIFIGVDLARSLNVYEGDEITVIPPESLLLPSGEVPLFERVRIKGLLQTDMPEFDTKVILFAEGLALNKFSKTKTLKRVMEIRLEDPNRHDFWKDKLITSLSLEEKNVETWSSRNSSLFFALKMEKMATLSLLGLSILVTTFSIIMVLLMIIAEKQKDVGLLMALGLSKKQTQVLFTKLGFLLAAAGTIGGLIFGLTVSYLIEKYPINFMPSFYVDRSLPSDVQADQIVILLIGLVLISFIAAYIPVKRALRMSPAEALKGIRAMRRVR